jgi:hypothetical protein
LVYYIGFWLPAALVGKLAGWNAANLALYIWSVLGVILVAVHLCQAIHSTKLWWSVLLLIFFSGMDILGVAIMRTFVPTAYPGLFPPIQHLENWSVLFQFSSQTTQLFWVFNQAVPCWLCLLLLKTGMGRRIPIVLLGLCFFFAPLPSIGLFPILLVELVSRLVLGQIKAVQATKSLSNVLGCLVVNLDRISSRSAILSGLSIIGLSWVYLGVNHTSHTLTFVTPDLTSGVLFVLFFLLEGGILWILLFQEFSKKPEWYLVGVILFICPWLKVGDGIDFVMRASIAPLFILMILSGDYLLHHSAKMRLGVIICLLLGMLTPIYEINRSVYRTIGYTHSYPISTAQINAGLPALFDVDAFPPSETLHPNSLVADELESLATVHSKVILNFLAIPDEDSLYTKIQR